MKYAIRINDGRTVRLFAVAKDYFYVSALRQAARKSMPVWSSDWVTVSVWVKPGQFMDQYEWAHFSAGDLF